MEIYGSDGFAAVLGCLGDPDDPGYSFMVTPILPDEGWIADVTDIFEGIAPTEDGYALHTAQSGHHEFTVAGAGPPSGAKILYQWESYSNPSYIEGEGGHTRGKCHLFDFDPAGAILAAPDSAVRLIGGRFAGDELSLSRTGTSDSRRTSVELTEDYTHSLDQLRTLGIPYQPTIRNVFEGRALLIVDDVNRIRWDTGAPLVGSGHRIAVSMSGQLRVSLDGAGTLIAPFDANASLSGPTKSEVQIEDPKGRVQVGARSLELFGTEALKLTTKKGTFQTHVTAETTFLKVDAKSNSLTVNGDEQITSPWGALSTEGKIAALGTAVAVMVAVISGLNGLWRSLSTNNRQTRPPRRRARSFKEREGVAAGGRKSRTDPVGRTTGSSKHTAD